MALRMFGAAASRGATKGPGQYLAAGIGLLLGGIALHAHAQQALGGDETRVTLASGRTYVVYGDILVPVDPESGARGAHAGAMWPAAKLHYTFHSSVNESQRTAFRQWAPRWEVGSGLRLVESASAANRVLVQAETGIGCGRSALGMQGGVQDLVIGCWGNSHTVLHELGHALGMIHEQQRGDRNNYISVQDQGVSQYCGAGTWNANFAIEAAATRSEYDFASVMHYGSFPGYGYTCDGHQVGASMTVLQPQPPGPPAGSDNVCTTVGDCQALIGTATDPSQRDGYSAALRYGYRLALSQTGDGSGSVSVSGQRESCGNDCYLVTPQTTFTVTATAAADSIARFSGPCTGRSCQFSAAANGEIVVRFFKKSSLMALVSATSLLMHEPSLFADGFEAR